MFRSFFNKDFIGQFLKFYGIFIFCRFLDKKKHIFLQNIIFLNDDDLPPVRRLYHTRFRIENVAIWSSRSNVFVTFSVYYVRKMLQLLHCSSALFTVPTENVTL